jgi:hypothetical protein
MLDIMLSGLAWRTTKIRIGTNESADVSSDPLFAWRSKPVVRISRVLQLGTADIPKMTLQQFRMQIILSLGAL